MYYVLVPLLTIVLPISSVIVEMFIAPGSDLLGLIGKWFTFWGIGVRLLLAGLSQIFNPTMTSRTILGLESSDANIVVQELGFANLAIGAVGIISLLMPLWLLPAALTGGLFLGLAGIRHVMKAERNARENIALVTDLIVSAAAILFVLRRLL